MRPLQENEFALLVPFSEMLPIGSLLAPGKMSTVQLMSKCQVTFYDIFVYWVFIIHFAGYADSGFPI